MRKIAFLAFFLLIMSFPLKAQNAYQLREPSATDYVRVASEAIGRCDWRPSQSTSKSAWNLCPYLLHNIETNYRDQLKDLPYDLLLGAYNSLQPGLDWNTPGDTYLWHEALVLAWLRDSEIDLDTQSEFTIGDLEIQVKRRDFNADGVNKYVLELDSLRFATFFVLTHETDGTYQRVPGWLPHHDGASPYWDYHSNYLREIAFDDFNADGLPEWFLAFDGASYRGDYLGEILLLGWRDGTLKFLTDGYISYIPFFNTNANNLSDNSVQDGFVFDNLDDDLALELQRIEITTDNWRCQQINTSIYDWDSIADVYVQTMENVHRSDTANCVMNDAENALFDNHYTVAASLYEYALTLPQQENSYSDATNFDIEMRQFIQLRLAQAYLLNREYKAASDLLDLLEAQDMVSHMLEKMRDILLTNRHASPGETCTTLYNLFEEAIRNAYNYSLFQEQIGTQLIIGVRWEFHGDFIGAGNPADPALAGCNVPGSINPYLDNNFYTKQDTPVEQLQGNGFPVSDHIRADFNGDGNNDWLIWYKANVPAVLLLDQGVGEPFALSRVDIQHPNEDVLAEILTLPDDAGTAIVLLRTLEGLPSYFGGFQCGESASVLGLLELWQYTEDGLTRVETPTWCDDYPTINDIFREEGNKHVFYLRDEQGEPIAHVWNAYSKRYGLLATEAATATQAPAIATQVSSTVPLQPMPSNEELYSFLGDGIMDYYTHLEQQIQEAGSTDEAIAILDAEINAPYMEYPFRLQFWKATILQEVGRDNAALAEYIAVYEVTPQSVWGKLAASHFAIAESNASFTIANK